MSSIESRVAYFVRNLQQVSPTDSYSLVLSHHPGANHVMQGEILYYLNTVYLQFNNFIIVPSESLVTDRFSVTVTGSAHNSSY